MFDIASKCFCVNAQKIKFFGRYQLSLINRVFSKIERKIEDFCDRIKSYGNSIQETEKILR